jgi:hypothetical protein
MFQNTANDLRQCLEAMDAAETMAELDLSRDEKRSYDLAARILRKLFEHC